MKIKNLDKIYVLNHVDFHKRREVIENSLKKEGIEYELVQMYHPNDIDYEKELLNWEIFEPVDIVQPHGIYQNFSKKISMGSLSLVLKHKWCYIDQIKNNYKTVLILEDDALIPDNFNEFLEKNVDEFIEMNKNESIGMLMVGTSHNFNVHNTTDGKYVYYNENQKTRCTHAYILDIDTTKKILPRFNIINLPIDFKLNEIIQVEGIKVAWTQPGLIQNG